MEEEEEDEEEEDEEEEQELKVEALQLHNVMEGNDVLIEVSGENLGDIEVMVDEEPMCVWEDIGATHKVVSRDETKEFGFPVINEPGWLKAADREAKRNHETAHGIHWKIGIWMRKIDYLVEPGMEFLHEASDARNAEHLTRRPRKGKVHGRSKESLGAFDRRQTWECDEGVARLGGGECHAPHGNERLWRPSPINSMYS